MNRFEDIVPPSRRKDSDSPVPPRPVGGYSRRRSSFPYATIVVVLVVIAAALGALVYFSSAKVEITPNTISGTVQGPFTASTQNSTAIPFQVITAQKVATQTVAGNGTKTVSTPASGTITIYNTQSKSQKLVANTRFATTAGLIFRIHAAVTIPGGTTAKPGSVTATVYADQPGATYNVSPTSFTVPGLAGTPQANEVYARSTSAMTGGASGTVPVVDSATESQARQALVDALTPDLLSSIQSQVPAGFVLLKGAATTTFEALPDEQASGTSVNLKEQGTVTAIVFPNTALAKAIAATIPGTSYQGEPVTLSSTDGLAFTLQGTVPDSTTQSIAFTLAGPANFVYSVDPSRIAAAVAGKSRSEAEVALTNYPEVKSAILVLRPFWRSSFPQDPSAIAVTVANQ